MALEEMEKKIQGSNEKPETELQKNESCIEDPSCVLEIPVTSSDSDNSSNCSSSSPDKTTSPLSTTPSNVSSFQQMIESIKKKKTMRKFLVVPLLASCELTRKNMRRKLPKLPENDLVCERILVARPSWRNFTFDELVAATDNFNPENLIGKGGHAEVYKGVLANGEIVAIKKLSDVKEAEEKVSDFLSELGIIAHVNHPNAAKLKGFSIDRGLHFVLEYSPNGSLSSLLFGSEDCLDWRKRYKVALGIADGLNYLHNDCPRRIIHRDIKASNILLSEDYEAQISDFGLAKWLPENWPHHICFPIEGTFGYLAPEYFMHGIVDEKTDVFAFGVLLLEIITGRRAVDTDSRQSLVIWAKPLLEKNNVEEIVDPQLGNEFDETEMNRVMQTASMCIHHVATMRPGMNQLAQLLRGGDDRLAEVQLKSGGARAENLHECDVDHTSSSYLDNLTRHRQLLME